MLNQKRLAGIKEEINPWAQAINSRETLREKQRGLLSKQQSRIEQERSKNFDSIARFARSAFPHWARHIDSKFHRYLDRRFRRTVTGNGRSKRADRGPRGYAKSTRVTRIGIAWLICHQAEISLRRGVPNDFVVIASNTLSLPKSAIDDLRREFTQNKYLEATYPEAFGQRAGNKWTSDLCRMANGVWILAASMQSPLRGVNQEGKRPTLLIGDDLENLEHAQTLGQRDKSQKWFEEDLVPCGDELADIWLLGTTVHPDSLLSRLAPIYGGKTYKAIRSFSNADELWDRWEEIYLDLDGELGRARRLSGKLWNASYKFLLKLTNDDAALEGEPSKKALNKWKKLWRKHIGDVPSERDLVDTLSDAVDFVDNYSHSLPDSFSHVIDGWEDAVLDPIREIHSRHGIAWEFFKRHEVEMLNGTSVLWPERETYYDLMCQKAEARNKRSFFQEKQNESLLEEDALFAQSNWRFYEAPSNPDPTTMRGMFDDDAVFVAACDPSKGRLDKKNDPAAIVVLGGVPGKYCRIAWASVRREKPSQITARILATHRAFNRDGEVKTWVIESNMFQELFADETQRKGKERKQPIYLPVDKLISKGDKNLRIEGLEPHITAGEIEYPGRKLDNGEWAPLFQTFWNQFLFYGQGEHDDGPDALEMAWRKWEKLSRGARVRARTNRKQKTVNSA
ncbi:MAG: phage terminase large subunit, partial [candidate division Zixibacteria bacterium]|nr:phage terminase large subunit [candidate division Zixibacteria bacterium]